MDKHPRSRTRRAITGAATALPLALGLGAVAVTGRSPSRTPRVVAPLAPHILAQGTGSEAVSNASCPFVGTHSVNHHRVPYTADSDEGLRNEAKRHVPAAGTPRTLTLDDFARLQRDVGDASAHKTPFTPQRAALTQRLPRPAGWDAGTLNRINDEGLPVLVVGGLTYDNEHLVNKDKTHIKSGQPKRMSLWEIHPITEFYVCVDAHGCDPAVHDQWIALADWADANP